MAARLIAVILLVGGLGVLIAQESTSRTIPIRLRKLETRTETVVKDGQTVTVQKTVPVVLQKEVAIIPGECAIVICDMWDKHWCPSATKRCDALARKVAPMIDSARDQGMTIIHCPSDTMKFYATHAARQRAKSIQPVKLPQDKKLPDPPLPIDDSDGGCDDVPQPNSYRAWTSQHEAIRIDPAKDFITDVGSEVYSILQDRKIKRVFVMGVHTNMCVLHRSFAIKQLRRWDIETYLVRDITDTMYNPKKPPFVSHDEGTRLVIEFIETHWCPSVTSEVLKK